MTGASSSSRGSRVEREATDQDCPQGCRDTDPRDRGMQLVTEYTGERRVVDVPGYGSEVVERTRRYLKCPCCGWVQDI